MDARDELEQLANLAGKVRAAQTAYFKTHGGLDECKKLERAIDRWLADRAARVAGSGQQPLFP